MVPAAPNTMTTYDYILAGGGMAGLSLAYHLIHSPLQDKKLLIIDREPKTENDRTWCFWTQEATAFDSILHRSWEQIPFFGTDFSKTYPLTTYRYHMIRGIDFYTFTQAALCEVPNVNFLYGDVTEIKTSDEGASVTVDGTTHHADWVFDSLYLPGEFKPLPDNYHTLWQHFKGWVIQTAQDTFTSEALTMFDFRTPQEGAMRFMYVLPLNAREALVEYTLFSPTLLTDAAYDRALTTYIKKILGINNYHILEVEKNKIPMTDQPFPRFPARRHMTIGTKGGRVKPSTGYAFNRTQHDSLAIVQSLVEFGDPTHIQADKKRFKLYDSIMLEVMENNGGRMADIFTAMFKNNPIEQIFSFLDEESTLPSELAIFTTVPKMPFIRGLLKTGLSPGR